LLANLSVNETKGACVFAIKATARMPTEQAGTQPTHADHERKT